MRTIETSSVFRRDFRRESRGRYSKALDALPGPVLHSLQQDAALEPPRRDHDLTGEWLGCRECHLRPDLLLIYRKRGDDVLQLVRLGSHSELFR